MLGNIGSESLITGANINQNGVITEVENKDEVKTTSDMSKYFDDSPEISDEARELLQKERDVDFFKSLVIKSPLDKDELNAIMELIRQGEFIDNKDLAEAMREDQDLLSHLFDVA